MSRFSSLPLFTLLASLLASGICTAQVPGVMTDIPATHSLVSMVMGDLGEPALLLQSGASPHDYAIKPSKATELSNSDIVFWTSAELTPWLPRAISSLAPKARSVELMDSPDTILLPFREAHNFAEHAEHAEQAEHDHGGIDPHAWLDPVNASSWLAFIADNLSELDPTNSHRYQGNADAARQQLDTLTDNIQKTLSPVKNRPFIVFHDSYHYFEERFDIHATAAIKLGDGRQAGIRQVESLRAILRTFPGACVFSEPQFSDRQIKTITQGLPATLGELDPLGSAIPPGKDLYRLLLEQLSKRLHECLSKIQVD